MTDLLNEALQTFHELLAAARAAADPEPTAMALATVNARGAPSVRTVLLKACDESGFVFYTHLASAKGEDLRDNPRAALLFHWKTLAQPVQVRIEGAVEQVDEAQADAYFATRPRLSQIGAWASRQSQTLASRADFEAAIAQAEQRFAGREVPRPPGWSGFRVRPDGMEFWYAGDFRLHERYRYDLRDGAWTKRMLFP